MAYYFPLIDFRMTCHQYVISKNLRIARTPFDLNKARAIVGLSEYHRDQLTRVEFWAVANGDTLSRSDALLAINTLLLVFWIVGPIRGTTFFKFKDYDYVTIFHDQFQYNQKDHHIAATDDVLARVATCFETLLRINKRNRRLQTALVNTYYSCVTVQWKVAFICISAALEAMLTYKRGWGITKRLAKSYACLTEHKQRRRNRAYRQFIRLYGIRSRIMHGEMRWLRNPERNLVLLSDFSALLRKLWCAVLGNKVYYSELEKSNRKREAFFSTVEKGYTPPNVKIF